MRCATVDELGEVRSILHGRPGADAWARLWELLADATPETHAYARDLLTRWPDALRVLPDGYHRAPAREPVSLCLNADAWLLWDDALAHDEPEWAEVRILRLRPDGQAALCTKTARNLTRHIASWIDELRHTPHGPYRFDGQTLTLSLQSQGATTHAVGALEADGVALGIDLSLEQGRAPRFFSFIGRRWFDGCESYYW